MGDEYREIFGDQSMDVRYAGNEGESPSDLDWGVGKLWGRQ